MESDLLGADTPHIEESAPVSGAGIEITHSERDGGQTLGVIDTPLPWDFSSLQQKEHLKAVLSLSVSVFLNESFEFLNPTGPYCASPGHI